MKDNKEQHRLLEEKILNDLAIDAILSGCWINGRMNGSMTDCVGKAKKELLKVIKKNF